MINIEDMQTALIQDGQRLSELFDAGQLTHDEWERTFLSWQRLVHGLPEEQRDAIDLELFYPIEPEKS